MVIQAVSGGLWSCADGEIRITPEGQPSVFDMIKVLGGQKNPRDVWERLIATHSEVVGKCDNLKFPGRGQRVTPIAKSKEDAYYILGLLPGAAGRHYREQAARLFTQFLDDPSSVAAAAVERMSSEQKEWLEARLKGTRTRAVFTDVLQAHGVEAFGYGSCTNAIYLPILGASAKQLKQSIAVEKQLLLARVNPRDHFSLHQLGDVETAERVAAGQLRRREARGNAEVEHVVRRSAEFTRQLLDGVIDIPMSF